MPRFPLASAEKGIGSLLVDRVMAVLAAEGITKSALLAFANDGQGSACRERSGFTRRNELVCRSQAIKEQKRIIAKTRRSLLDS